MIHNVHYNLAHTFKLINNEVMCYRIPGTKILPTQTFINILFLYNIHTSMNIINTSETANANDACIG
jgi:hypothetical protein